MALSINFRTFKGNLRKRAEKKIRLANSQKAFETLKEPWTLWLKEFESKVPKKEANSKRILLEKSNS